MDLQWRSAALADAHNKHVLCDLLGIPREDVREGYRDGTFWPKDLPLEPYLDAALDVDAHLDPLPEGEGAPAPPLACGRGGAG